MVETFLSGKRPPKEAFILLRAALELEQDDPDNASPDNAIKA
jgi:hypothetical protein